MANVRSPEVDMNWIAEHWDFIVEIITIIAGLALLAWKNYQKWQQSGEDSFINWVAGIVVDELRRLAGIAEAEMTEEFVEAKAIELWLSFGGNPKHADDFGGFVWFVWSGLVESSESDVDRGVIGHRQTHLGMVALR